MLISCHSSRRTLFWAGDIFAPKLLVQNGRGQAVPVQQFLQGAFLDMWAIVAQAVGDLEGVLGFQVCFRAKIWSFVIQWIWNYR